MEFPEKSIYTELIAELKQRTYYFESAGHKAPAHYDWDRAQYVLNGERKEHPFNRAAVFFKFGTMAYERHGALSRRGTVPLTITCVQDKYVDSMDGASSQPEYLKLLEWKYLINNVLDGFTGNCFTALELIEIDTDHDNRNYHVETIQYELKVTLMKNRLPLSADVTTISADSEQFTADQT